MKGDRAFYAALDRATENERALLSQIKGLGLRAELTTMQGHFALGTQEKAATLREIDANVEGFRCQFKHRTISWSALMDHGYRPIVDDKRKADRTPVDFYIFSFPDRVMVCAYRPQDWQQLWVSDIKDHSRKLKYTVDPGDCIPLERWAELLKIRTGQRIR